MSDAYWPWLVLAGLGAFHGLNPAMGWLFAVALGLHRQSLAALFCALPAIAAGHALSVAAVAFTAVIAGAFVEPRSVQIAAGLGLIGWACWHWRFGHRGRVRVGMRTGLMGLAAWSFLMATAHGAGLMVLPALIPLCLAGAPAAEITRGGGFGIALAAVGVHSGAMLAVTGLIAFTVYRFVGLAILRSAWVNLDLIWTAALIAAGLLLLLAR